MTDTHTPSKKTLGLDSEGRAMRVPCDSTRGKRVGSDSRPGPRLLAALDGLPDVDREFLQTLLDSCYVLANAHPVYAQTLAFSISDVGAELAKRGIDDSWHTRISVLHQRSLLSLHKTIPSVAASLGLDTIKVGNSVASAISFPMRLWLAHVPKTTL